MTEPFLFCTSAANDVDLVRALGSAAVSLPIFTDCCFSSTDNKLVACERKKVGDLAQCVCDGRLLFQIQGCKEAGADYLVLILEGRYRRNLDDGTLEIPVWGVNPRTLRRAEVWRPVRPSMQFSRFDQYLTELSRDVGVIIKHTENVRGTADVILALYRNFQTAGDDHHSLRRIFKPAPPVVQLVRPSLVRRVACELPGIGWEWSGVAGERFCCVKEMVAAGVNVWSGLTLESGGMKRRLGKKVAGRVVSAIRGGS